MTMRTLFTIYLLFSAFCIQPTGFAQSGVNDEAGKTTDSLEVLRSTLEQRQGNQARLERIVSALNVVDSVYKSNYPSWTILDADLRERTFRSFTARGLDVSREDPVVVIADTVGSEILELSMGETRMGRMDTRIQLSDSLFQEILSGAYLRGPLEENEVVQPTGKLYGDRPEFGSVNVSLFGAGVLFHEKWGVELTMGHEEVGYHFWSTGSARFMAAFDQLKVGVVVPFKYGRTISGPLKQLDIRPRLLSGPTGFSAAYDAPLSGGTIGSRLTVADLTKVSFFDLLTDSSGSYFLHTVGQIFYGYPFVFEGGKRILALTGGLGYHQIAFGAVQPDRSVTTISKENFLGPIIRIEYQNRGSSMFGASLQLYSSILHIKGWVELIKNFMFIDLQYYTPFVRDPKPWEQSYFFMVSPRFQVIY